MKSNWFTSKEFENQYNYQEKLGFIYSKEKTKFIIWAPTASKVNIALYGKDPFTAYKRQVLEMEQCENGTWNIEINYDLDGEFYTYLVEIDDLVNEIVDPYAKAVSVNGRMSMVVDLKTTNPIGWDQDCTRILNNPTDAVIYEIHIRDFSSDINSTVNETIRGKYLGFVVEDSKLNNTNVNTGLAHLKELGITHVHLLPSFDYGSIDESDKTSRNYNWGYDPLNYNVPEGSYSTNPFDGKSRIREFKEMVQKLHENGIGVIMDVVYNHTYNLNSWLNKAVPGYYYRTNAEGEYSDGAGCGNETASERFMFRKYMVDSVMYWAEEYHIDGFRFDLMGLHDIETMKEIRNGLNNISKEILMYGEGWTCNESPLDNDKAALKDNTNKYGKLQIAAFSDDARDVVKGKVFYKDSLGFANGGTDLEETVKFMVVAATEHEEVDISKGMYSKKFWANEPYQTVTYDSAHDNYTLYDKLIISNESASEEEIIKMNKLISAAILTSQGIAFLHGGEELARRKVDEKGNIIENSFISSDYVNSIKWSNKIKYNDLFQYYKGLISLRRKNKAFRMNSNAEIRKNISFKNIGKNIVAYTINAEKYEDQYKEFMVILNGNDDGVNVDIEKDQWVLLVNDKFSGVEPIRIIKEKKVTIPGKAAFVLGKK